MGTQWAIKAELQGKVEGLCHFEPAKMAIQKGRACRILIKLPSLLKNAFSAA